MRARPSSMLLALCALLALAALVKRADPVRAGTYGSASLFVDDGAEEVGYATITTTVANGIRRDGFRHAHGRRGTRHDDRRLLPDQPAPAVPRLSPGDALMLTSLVG